MGAKYKMAAPPYGNGALGFVKPFGMFVSIKKIYVYVCMPVKLVSLRPLRVPSCPGLGSLRVPGPPSQWCVNPPGSPDTLNACFEVNMKPCGLFLL